MSLKNLYIPKKYFFSYHVKSYNYLLASMKNFLFLRHVGSSHGYMFSLFDNYTCFPLMLKTKGQICLPPLQRIYKC